jgi:hypothetical protein
MNQLSSGQVTPSKAKYSYDCPFMDDPVGGGGGGGLAGLDAMNNPRKSISGDTLTNP